MKSVLPFHVFFLSIRVYIIVISRTYEGNSMEQLIRSGLKSAVLIGSCLKKQKWRQQESVIPFVSSFKTTLN